MRPPEKCTNSTDWAPEVKQAKQKILIEEKGVSRKTLKRAIYHHINLMLPSAFYATIVFLASRRIAVHWGFRAHRQLRSFCTHQDASNHASFDLKKTT